MSARFSPFLGPEESRRSSDLHCAVQLVKQSSSCSITQRTPLFKSTYTIIHDRIRRSFALFKEAGELVEFH